MLLSLLTVIPSAASNAVLHSIHIQQYLPQLQYKHGLTARNFVQKLQGLVYPTKPYSHSLGFVYCLYIWGSGGAHEN